MFPWEVASRFGLDDVVVDAEPFGAGLIHETWRVEAAGRSYLMQRMNEDVFGDARMVVANAAATADRVDDALTAAGDHDPRHRLVYLRTPEGQRWVEEPRGAIWRAMPQIAVSRPPNLQDAAEVRNAAEALGRFPFLVAAGRGPDPVEVLPGFHDTPARLEAFRRALEDDVAGRRAGCARLADRLLEMAPIAGMLDGPLRRGELPIRPVHNDAKLDNVLVDAATGEALCVVDLDTVMPGLLAHDFGDLVRSAVSGAAEDEADLGSINVDMGRFADLARGYLRGVSEEIGEVERASLVTGALVITYEQALRFLGDHLAGDRYYAVSDAEHNLRRGHAQVQLLEQLIAAEYGMQDIVGRG